MSICNLADPRGRTLRLRDPDDPSWTNITEVRGYADAAKHNDLQRLAQFAEIFSNQTGSPPERPLVHSQSVPEYRSGHAPTATRGQKRGR